ncbi:MAG TPA: NAD(P)H-quinone dehydrogenase [Acidimicrobiia bacterium]|nr:NAD(P)H-quinone dehydrogenase [Acidimicrobiia bacterium]
MAITDNRHSFLIIGAGPAGTAAATNAAALGAQVTLVERDIVGGAAHLWDCIPSKTLTATAIRIDSIRNADQLGLKAEPGQVDSAQLGQRVRHISGDINRSWTSLLGSQGVEIINGLGRLVSPELAEIDTPDGARRVRFDRCLLSTGSSPRVPDWAEPDGDRILTTRHAYDLKEVPGHVVVIGSGVTGVEFVHIFESLGSKVTLVVSRQQVLPHRDPEVAAVLEKSFLEKGVRLVIGARATGIERSGDEVVVLCDDGRRVQGTHVLLAIGAVPQTAGLGLDEAGIVTRAGYIEVDEFSRTSVPHIYAAGDCTGQMLLSSVAAMQGRKIARHAGGLPVTPLDYSKVAQAVFTEPEIASVGLEEAEAAAEGRKVRTTKVPFAANARAVLQGNTEGFVKVISDPATGVVLGGTIVGHRASELIGILALAVQARATVNILVETVLVHPSLSESISDAAE